MVAHQTAIESLWEGVCTVTVQGGITNETTKLEEFSELNLYTAQPCKLSYKILQSVGGGEVAELKQVATLFISSGVSIPAGSKITITQKGVTEVYTRSGKAAIYTYHQEIPLQIFKGWA